MNAACRRQALALLIVNGKPVDEAQHKNGFTCHAAYVRGRDVVFSRNAP